MTKNIILTEYKYNIMVYFGINNKKEFYFSNSLTDLCGYFDLNHQTVRNKFSACLSDVCKVRGVTIYKGEPTKIQGRGRDLKRL